MDATLIMKLTSYFFGHFGDMNSFRRSLWSSHGPKKSFLVIFNYGQAILESKPLILIIPMVLFLLLSQWCFIAKTCSTTLVS